MTIPAGLETFNELTALRWFLYVLRHCNPLMLEELAKEGAPLFSESDERGAFHDWYAGWVARHFLPDTEHMKAETRSTLRWGYLEESERRWHFELPPDLNEAQIAEYSRQRALEPAPELSLRVELPACPTDALVGSETKFKSYVQRATLHVEAHLKAVRSRMKGHRLFSPEDVWLLLPRSRELLNPKRPMGLVARDLCYLAMKQAGASYSEIPQKFAGELAGSLVQEHLVDEQKAPRKDEVIRRAVEKAAEHIGLGTIRAAKPGPKPTS